MTTKSKTYAEDKINAKCNGLMTEKIATVMTLDYLKAKAAKGKRKDFEKYLSMVPALEGDERV